MLPLKHFHALQENVKTQSLRTLHKHFEAWSSIKYLKIQFLLNTKHFIFITKTSQLILFRGKNHYLF
jgi:hypothetical protein